MRIVFVLATLVVLMLTAGAETIQFGNYTANFDMNQPHIIDNNSIRTFYENILFLPREYSASVPVGQFKGNYLTYELSKTSEMSALPPYLARCDDYPITIISWMNLTSTLDFLKTLKIEKRS